MGEKSTIKDTTSKYFSYATVHGYPHIWGETGRLRRFIWMILCLLLTGYTVYQIAFVISVYSTYPKTISRDFEENRREVTFPGVTICTLSPLPRSPALEDHLMFGSFISVEEAYNTTDCDYKNPYIVWKPSTKSLVRMSRSRIRWKRSDYDEAEGQFGDYYNFGDESTEESLESREISRKPSNNYEKTRRFKREAGINLRTHDSNMTANCSGGLYCSIYGYCMPSFFICDQYWDCPDGIDERHCSCLQGQFTCNDGTCIDGNFQCDNWADCNFGEDESNCSSANQTISIPDATLLSCPTGNKTCANGACLREMYFCDGVKDCKDGDDEENCESCSERSFRCDNGTCIPSHHVCDGEYHCGGFEDEDNCTTVANGTSCPEDYLLCRDGNCINPRFICNGKEDCTEGEDEDNSTLCDTNTYAVNLMSSPAHYTRIKCSEIYSDTLYILYGRSVNDKIQSNMTCDISGGTFLEEASFSPMCVTGYICDFFGCYTTNGKFYSEYNKFSGLQQLCTVCLGVEVCWSQLWINQWKLGELTIQSLETMLKKKGSTLDFDSMASLFIPTEEDIDDYSIPAEEFIYSCKFDGYIYESSKFLQWKSDDLGTCYSFNSPSDDNERIPYNSTIVGPKHGLEITLNVHSGMALLSNEIGVRVSIHNPNVLPVPLEDGFNVGPGKSSIRLSRTQYNRIGLPHGNCTSNYGRDGPSMDYSRSVCMSLCIENRIRDKCNCTSGSSPIYKNMEHNPGRACDYLAALDAVCLKAVDVEVNNGEIDCNYCHQPCKEMVFTPKVTTSKPNERHFDLLHQFRRKVSSLCSDYTNLLTLNIYIDSPYYEIITETPSYTFDTLLSNVGGSLGLFIGVSIISIMEVIEFVLDIALVAMGARSRRVHDTEEKGQSMYPDDGCGGSCASSEALQQLKKDMKIKDQEILETLRREMAEENEKERMQFQAYLDSSVERIMGNQQTTGKHSGVRNRENKDKSSGMRKNAFNALFLK